MGSPMSTGVSLALVALLITINAWLVAAKYAIASVPREYIAARKSAGGRRARILVRVLDDLEQHITAIRLCTIASTLIVGWLGIPLVRAALAGPLRLLGLDASAATGPVSAVASFATVATAMLVLGSSLPKYIGLRRSERVALWSAYLLRGVAKLALPIQAVLEALTRLLARLLRIGDPSIGNAETDQQELRLIMSQLTGVGRLSDGKRRFLENVLLFSTHTARQIMVPRDRIVALSLAFPLDDNMEIIRSTGHTRYPLCEAGVEQVIGMIHIKDLFSKTGGPRSVTDLRNLRRNLPVVPESLPLDELQKTFETERAHMAIVIDEHGGVIGLVTLEDVLEKLVGDIRDEFDHDESPAISIDREGMLVDGMMLVDDLCRRLDVELKDSEADTVGGYVTESLGKIGKVGDRFRLGDFDGRVAEMEGRRVSRVYLSTGDAPPYAADERSNAE